ncbi:4-alpha-glucanotransferase, partial [Bifidobacterium xylocopae]
AEPVPPLTPSPYLPASRSFVNFCYIRPEAVEEYASLDEQTRQEIARLHESVAGLNEAPQLLNRDAMWGAKMRAPWLLFKAPRSQARQAGFDRYKALHGQGLDAYASWGLCYDKWGSTKPASMGWERTMCRESPEVEGLRRKFPSTYEFYKW